MPKAGVIIRAFRTAKGFLSKSVKTLKFSTKWLAQANSKWKLGSWFMKGLDVMTWGWFLWDAGDALFGGDGAVDTPIPPLPQSILKALLLEDASDRALQQAFVRAGAQVASQEDEGRALQYFALADYLRSCSSVGELMYSDQNVAAIFSDNAQVLKDSGLVPEEYAGLSESDVSEISQHAIPRKVMDYMAHFVELLASISKDDK